MGIAMDRRAATDHFWSRVDQSGGPDACWPWTGSIFPTTGYGQARMKAFGDQYIAHRIAYWLSYGDPPEGHQIDHTCHNDDLGCAGGKTCQHRRCCNPAHLEAVPPGTNIARANGPRGRLGGATHCPKGHPYDKKNTKRVKLKSGGWGRQCRACTRELSYERRTGEQRPAAWDADMRKNDEQCRNGHPRTPENVKVSSDGHLRCVPCTLESRAKTNKKRRQARKLGVKISELPPELH